MKRNVYLPDDLDRRAKEAELPLSRLLQAAVVEELDRREAMKATLSEPREFKLDLENENGDHSIGRITGQSIAQDYDRSDSAVYLTEDQRVIVYDGAKLKYWVLDDPEQELRDWLPEDAYVEAMGSLGITPVIDI